MAIGDLFKRKKKPDYLDLEGVPGAVPGYGPAGYGDQQQMGGMPSMGGMPPMPSAEQLPGLPPMEPFPQQMQQQQPARMASGDIENIRSQIESINYKLDTLNAKMDSLNTRLANIENALKATPGGREGGWTY